MVSGRGAVSKGWSRLSEEVRCGPLSNSDGSGPNRRALRPLIRRLFRDYKVSVLASADNTLEEHYDPAPVVERIVGADSWLRQVGLLLDEVKAELVSRQVTGMYDLMFTLTIARVPEPDKESDQESRAKLVISICDALTCDASRSVAALKRLFDDPVQHDRMERDLATRGHCGTTELTGTVGRTTIGRSWMRTWLPLLSTQRAKPRWHSRRVTNPGRSPWISMRREGCCRT